MTKSHNEEAHVHNKTHRLRYVVISMFAFMVLSFIIVIINSAQQTARFAEQARLEKARLDADPITVSSIYNALNKERSVTGAGALASLSNLTTAADQYCNDMVTNKYFDYKNPTSGKESNSFITDNIGDLYFKHYVTSIFSASVAGETATDALTKAVATQATNLNNPEMNSVGWSICQSPFINNQKYIVGAFAEKADRPAAPTTVYVPVTRDVPVYTPPTSCTTTYNSNYGYSNPTATTRCY